MQPGDIFYDSVQPMRSERKSQSLRGIRMYLK